MKIHVIFNPASNNFKSYKTLDLITHYFDEKKIDYFVHTTQYKNHAKTIVSQLTQDKVDKKIICVGGDGTIHECLNGIQDFEHTYFGIVPAGSGNDFVANFEIYKSKDYLSKILDKIVENNWSYVDYYTVNDKVRAINCIGFGIDANILKTYSKLKLFSQKVKYKIATISNSLFFKIHKCSYQIDDQPVVQNDGVILIIMGGGKRAGSGLLLNPNSVIDDGLLSVSIINKINRLQTIPMLTKVIKSKLQSLKTWESFKCKQIKITMDRKLYECDGEMYEDTNELVIKPITKELKLIH